ncbi:TRAP transporter small permease [Rhodovibrionaceae bacterium A322]
MQRIFHLFRLLEEWLMALLAGFSLVLAVIEMVLRYYLPRQLPDWTAEVVVYFITSAVLLSGGLLVSEKRHIRADFLFRQLPLWTQRLLDLSFTLVGLAVCAVFFDRGLEIVDFALRLDERSDSSLQFPVFIYYSIVPVSFGLMFLHYLTDFCQQVLHFRAPVEPIPDPFANSLD